MFSSSFLDRNIKTRIQEMLIDSELEKKYKKINEETKLTKEILDELSLNDFWKFSDAF